MTTAGGALRLWAAAFALFATTAGRPTAVRGVALMAGLALPAGVLFGSEALAPSEVARWFDHSVAVRALFLVVASVLGAPVLAPGLVAPGTLFCRSLPVARVRWVSLTAAWALAVQAPALFLFGAAGAFSDAAVLGCSAAACSLTLAAGVTDARGVAAALTTSVTLIAAVPGALAVPVTLAMLGVAARAAWIRAPEAVARRGEPPQLVAGPPWCALAVVHGLRLLRQDTVALIGWLPLSLGAGLLAALGVRNRAGIASTPPILIVLLVAILPLAVVTGATCQRVLDNERGLRWILDATGGHTWERHAAAAVTLSIVAVAAGALIAATVALADGWPAPAAARCLAGCTACGVGLGLLLLAWGRRALRDRSRDRARYALGTAVFGGLALSLVAVAGQAVAYAVLGLAILVTVLASMDRGPERAHD